MHTRPESTPQRALPGSPLAKISSFGSKRRRRLAKQHVPREQCAKSLGWVTGHHEPRRRRSGMPPAPATATSLSTASLSGAAAEPVLADRGPFRGVTGLTRRARIPALG